MKATDARFDHDCVRLSDLNDVLINDNSGIDHARYTYLDYELSCVDKLDRILYLSIQLNRAVHTELLFCKQLVLQSIAGNWVARALFNVSFDIDVLTSKQFDYLDHDVRLIEFISLSRFNFNGFLNDELIGFLTHVKRFINFFREDFREF
ncbi:MAG: hypothetical protein M1817_004386 [Caeruleum heppii]|nr:MAG: hypothetical protein M1817_004386 [Caeruleum heppii]